MLDGQMLMEANERARGPERSLISEKNYDSPHGDQARNLALSCRYESAIDQ
jgi:hypothetical protein